MLKPLPVALHPIYYLCAAKCAPPLVGCCALTWIQAYTPWSERNRQPRDYWSQEHTGVSSSVLLTES
jgi:hypothetical protein